MTCWRKSPSTIHLLTKKGFAPYVGIKRKVCKKKSWVDWIGLTGGYWCYQYSKACLEADKWQCLPLKFVLLFTPAWWLFFCSKIQFYLFRWKCTTTRLCTRMRIPGFEEWLEWTLFFWLKGGLRIKSEACLFTFQGTAAAVAKWGKERPEKQNIAKSIVDLGLAWVYQIYFFSTKNQVK